MLTVQYTKLGRARFLPHLDTLRHIQRILRRAQIEVEYSQGFNPHMLINMSAPLPLGFMSECEFFTVRTNVSADSFVQGFNACSVEGLKIVHAVEVAKDPVVASRIDVADYLCEGNCIGKHCAEIAAALNNSNYTYAYSAKGKIVEKQIADGVCSFSIEDNKLYATVLCGNKTLRLDRVLAHVLAGQHSPYCVDITRKVVYTIDSATGNRVELLSFLKQLGGER